MQHVFGSHGGLVRRRVLVQPFPVWLPVHVLDTALLSPSPSRQLLSLRLDYARANTILVINWSETTAPP